MATAAKLAACLSQKGRAHGCQTMTTRMPFPRMTIEERMSEFRRCADCGEHGYFNTQFMPHRCKPKWECRREVKWEEDWQDIRATDPEEAAEAFAERWDCEGGEYGIVGGRYREGFIVQVRKPGEAEFERWAIEGEAVPKYYGVKLENAVAKTNS